MSTELHINHDVVDAQFVSAEMIGEAVEHCFVSVSETPERALELALPEDARSNGDDGETDGDSDVSQEIETVEEVSLKNGVYHEIKRKLGERFGIPPHEIAFIHEADTPAKKAALYGAVNSGRVRVLIGSTSKLGTGVNVQKRLVALHHVDEPWKPAELEQREGRILRQGNIYSEAFIFHYVTERSFDGYMLQTLESKARFISQIMAGEVTARTAEDVGDMVLTVAQVKAIASGNPLVQRRIELEVKLVKLDRLRAAYYNNRALMRTDLEELPLTITAHESDLRAHEEAIRARLQLEDDSFVITLKRKLGEAENTTFDKRERAGAHLRYLADLLADRLRRGGERRLREEIGSYRGFKVFVAASGNNRLSHLSTLFNFQSEIHLQATDNGATYIANIGESNVGITQSIDYQLRHLEDCLEQTGANLEMLRVRLATVRDEVGKPWAFASEHRRLRRAYEAMGAALRAEGIEIDGSTDFTVEDEVTGNTDVETEDENILEALGEAFDETSARRNTLTGLEDWAIVAPEQVDESFDAYSLANEDSETEAGSMSFNFSEATEETSGEDGDSVEDIFLLPPCDGVDDSMESLQSGNLSEGFAPMKVSGLKSSDDAEDECRTSDVWQAAITANNNLNKRCATRTKSKKSKQPKHFREVSSGQCNLLWDEAA